MMYKIQDFIGPHSAETLRNEKIQYEDRYCHDLMSSADNLKRVCRECSVDQIRLFGTEIAEVEKWLTAIKQKAE